MVSYFVENCLYSRALRTLKALSWFRTHVWWTNLKGQLPPEDSMWRSSKKPQEIALMSSKIFKEDLSWALSSKYFDKIDWQGVGRMSQKFTVARSWRILVKNETLILGSTLAELVAFLTSFNINICAYNYNSCIHSYLSPQRHVGNV